MAAAATDKFVEVGDPGSATTLDGNYTVGDSSIIVVSTTNWPTATGVVFAIDEVTTENGEQVRTPGTYNVYQGTVASSTSITNVSHISGTGTDRNYTAGTSTRVYIVVSSEIQNRLVNGILTHADQDGTLKAGAVDNAAVLSSDVVTTDAIADNAVTSVLLDVAESTDFANPVALTANTWTDFKANQNFTVVAGSTVLINISTSTIAGGTSTATVASRIVIDSAGTPITRYYGGTQSVGTNYANPFSGGSTIAINGLAAGVHTIKTQVLSTANNNAYCRTSTLPNSEFYRTTVIENKK